MQESANQKALTVDQAAEQLGVSVWSVRAAISRGELAYFRLGKRVLVPVAAVDQIIANAQAANAEGAVEA